MRRGHMKKLARPKMGKAAIWAEIQGQGKEVSRGRAVFSRSVNAHVNQRWYYDDFEDCKAAKRQAWMRDIACDMRDYEEDDWGWEDSATYDCQEEDWEWAPIDSYVPIEVQTSSDSRRESNVEQKWTDLDRLARTLRPCGGILEKERFGKGAFVDLQKELLAKHGRSLCSELSRSIRRMVHVRPAPVSADVQQRFLEARTEHRGAELTPGYHGTNVSNLSAIYQRGLLIPGPANGIGVANGSAHGLGVYTAKVNNPHLSWGFCRAPTEMDRKMMVCGILDDAPAMGQHYQMGIRTVSRESANVRHVGDAMVIFDDRRVAPFFEVSLGDESSRDFLRTVAFDWGRWLDKVNRISKAFPLQRRKQRRAPLVRQQARQRTVVAYLTRRAVSKRNPKCV